MYAIGLTKVQVMMKRYIFLSVDKSQMWMLNAEVQNLSSTME